MTRIIRHIMPLGPRVLVKVLRLLETKEVIATVAEIGEDELS